LEKITSFIPGQQVLSLLAKRDDIFFIWIVSDKNGF